MVNGPCLEPEIRRQHISLDGHIEKKGLPVSSDQGDDSVQMERWTDAVRAEGAAKKSSRVLSNRVLSRMMKRQWKRFDF